MGNSGQILAILSHMKITGKCAMCLFPTFASVKLIARGEGIGLVVVGLYVLNKYHPDSSELHWITLQQV